MKGTDPARPGQAAARRASSSRTGRCASTGSGSSTSAPGQSLVEVVLHEGRKHVVRRLLAEVGHPVEGLVRVKVGPIGLGDLRSGKLRTLTITEVGELYAAVGL